MSFKKRAVAIVGVATILGTSLFTVAGAAGTDIKGKITSMNIFNNGVAISVPQGQQPIIVNDRTYLPVSALGTALGKNVAWGGPSKPNDIYITGDQIDQQQFNKMALDVNTMKLQVAEKDSKIKDLEDKVKKLEEDLKKKEEDTTSTLTDLEKKLNKDYGKYDSMYFDIKVKGTTSRIDVQIEVEKRDQDYWEKLSSSKQEKYIKDVVYAVEKDFKKASIEGSVYSGSRSTEIDFDVDSRGRLNIKGSSSSSGSRYALTSSEIRDLEDDIKWEFSYDVSSAYVKDDGDYMDVEIRTKSNLSSSQLRSLEKDIESYLDKRYTRKSIYVVAKY